MNNIELTPTELLVRVNKLKMEHEQIKREIADHLISIEMKEKQMTMIEEEYVQHMKKMTS